MDFSVPIQKNTEREIFDYIDLESLKKLLTERWFTWSLRYAEDELLPVDNEEDALESEELENSLEADNEILSDEEVSERDTESLTGEKTEAQERAQARNSKNLNTEI